MSMPDRLARLYFQRFPIEIGKWHVWCGIRHRLNPRAVGQGVTALPDGQRMLIDPHDQIGKTIFYWGMWEPNETYVLERLLRPGACFVDIGANIGWFTLAAARLVGPTGRVIAIEATPPTADVLRANVAMNGHRNITIHDVAVSDAAGSLRINHMHATNAGMNSIRAGAETDEYWTVPAERLDALIGAEQEVGLVKMDVEGAEVMALRGMTGLLARRDAPDVMCEITPDYLHQLGSSAAELLGLFAAAGYTGLLIGNRCLTELPLSFGEGSGGENVLFTRQPERVMAAMG